MPEWSTGEVLAAVFLVGTPLVVVVAGAAKVVADAQSARRLRRAAREREAARRPAPGSLVVEGRVVVPGALDGPRVVTRHQFGCLGGPVVHDVTAFELEREDGARIRIETGDNPVVENLALLLERAPAPTDVRPEYPPHTGGPLAVALLRGRVRVAGLAENGGSFVPARGGCAVLTILDASNEPPSRVRT